MYPNMTLNLFLREQPLVVHCGTFLMALSVIICSAWFYREFKDRLKLSNIILFLSSVTLFSILGARLFHAVFERPQYFLANPLEVFRSFDGMTFYGAFFMGALAVALFTTLRMKNPHLKRKVWDFSVLGMSLTYGLMRVGCFLSGCCWGTITPLPWGVRYFDQASVMPFKGIPVHPVQLYDALLGFGLFVLLFKLRKTKTWQGKLIIPTIIIYPLGRFITEHFRGDSFRGEDIILGLSTSQVISVGLVLVGFALMVQHVILPRKAQISSAGKTHEA